MTKMRVRIKIGIISILITTCLVSLTFSPVFGIQPAPTDLTGVWNCDDKGVYYIKQVGTDVYWYGEEKGISPRFGNIAYGKINGDIVTLKWVDIPKGTTKALGELTLKSSSIGTMGAKNKVIWTQTLVATKKTGGFGGSQWTKQ